MDDDNGLAARAEEREPRLNAVAYRMLGSSDEADEAVRDAVRESVREAVHETMPESVPASVPGAAREPAPGTARRPTAGGRVLDALARNCLERLRARESHRTAPWDPWALARHDPAGPDPSLLTALDTLTPPERLAFVLHDLFDVPYEEIARILERTPAAARQLAAHGRHRVQGTEEMPEPDPARQRKTVAACLTAARAGDSETLRALLDPDVTLRADPTAVRAGVRPAHGAGAVAPALAGRILEARPALVDGAAGLVLSRGGRPGTVFSFTVLDGRITSVDVLADEGHLSRMTVQDPAEDTAPA
ncbi:RNA polymerase, sigma-24 subunit, ECF subfamily [Streptomyces venezuelae]|uniref:sigma factor-like helix-turn-helix DNA-binding protein n=1 Tax=Streptomyces gardneri TaxID=66892 RepID=UPI0006BD933A|nr:sigma factor-like helix-turn-helix DNA-binding protein [Streptomyces gardneri]ALO09306.1 RNA polymerase, sigma-24 subunit, ECF subfamily [Streptomyces venezuelae]WRK37806.1 sigma factor-like helix-turn-helix DNA-binding protein [Streptomyces venezuelae]CUM40287.1 putative RNA polymerase sigma factor [Streptomyces venezuelae]